MSKSKKNKIRIYAKEDRHFRSKRTNAGGKPGKHPAYVVGEGKNVYASFGITHDRKKGKGTTTICWLSIPIAKIRTHHTSISRWKLGRRRIWARRF